LLYEKDRFIFVGLAVFAAFFVFTGYFHQNSLLIIRKNGTMARRDQLTGKGPVAGNHVSHAHNKAKRRFEINIQKKRFYVPEEDRWITLRVSAQTIKTINKKGISAVLKQARRDGVKV
jgi:large subunit ribosomal protein L28